MKICLIDTETTGTNPYRHELIEIGFIVFNTDDPDEIFECNMKVKPEHIDRADPQALLVNGFREEDWADAKDLKEALTFLQVRAYGAIFMAYNVTFDWNFIDVAFKRYKLQSPFNYHKICVMSMAWLKLPHLKSISLKSVCAELGLPVEDDIHRALHGAQRAFAVYKKLLTI